MPNKLPEKAWVVTVDMGYGHQRAAYPLHKIAAGQIINANNYQGIPARDKELWAESRVFYEFISRFKKVPLIGERAFALYDKFQEIPKFYPRRDLSRSNYQLRQIYKLFGKNWGRHLIDKLSAEPRPLVTTFFIIAMMAEYFDYQGEIYCILCDADISRTWVPLDPKATRIIFLASNKRVEERLKLYGVRSENIFFTGFPLPEENVGDKLKTLKADLGRRLIQLDPDRFYINQYLDTLNAHIGRDNLKLKPTRPLTITFAVGGAGAQRELGGEILKSLRKDILKGKIRLNLVAGINSDVNVYFNEQVRLAHLTCQLKKCVNVVYDVTKLKYFRAFNKILRQTDILWTKPSELSFYCALGLPIIIAPPIGSQEIFNQTWLRSIGAGMDQDDPRYVNEWLYDWLKSGWLAEAAMAGFIEAPKYGTYNVEKIIFHKVKEAKKVQTVLQY